jgi:hypothetical protein
MDVEREYHDRTRGAYASRDLGCGKVQAGRLHRRHLAKAAFAFQFLATARGLSTSVPFHTRTLVPVHSCRRRCTALFWRWLWKCMPQCACARRDYGVDSLCRARQPRRLFSRKVLME